MTGTNKDKKGLETTPIGKGEPIGTDTYTFLRRALELVGIWRQAIGEDIWWRGLTPDLMQERELAMSAAIEEALQKAQEAYKEEAAEYLFVQ